MVHGTARPDILKACRCYWSSELPIQVVMDLLGVDVDVGLMRILLVAVRYSDSTH